MCRGGRRPGAGAPCAPPFSAWWPALYLQHGAALAYDRRQDMPRRATRPRGPYAGRSAVVDGCESATPTRSPDGDTCMALTPHAQKVRLSTYTLPGGWQVLIGRTHADNEVLSFRVARPEDWWFHVRGMPGSHVILQVHQVPTPIVRPSNAPRQSPRTTAKRAKQGVVAVSGTRVRDVSKPRGAKAGTVQIRHEKVFKVRPAPGSLAREPGNHLSLTLGRAASQVGTPVVLASGALTYRPTVTGACAGVGSRVPAWAGAAAARRA